MNQHTTNYETLKHLSYIRFGHKIGRGWYAILITAEKELCDLGLSIRNVKRVDGALIVSIEEEATSFIDGYADSLLMEGIAGSYGGMSWES